MLLWQGRLDMEGWTWLVFKQNYVKLRWAFMTLWMQYTILEILQNDLSKDNIILHFLINKLDVMYIGMCDWGETICMQEVTLSLYVFAMEWDFIDVKKIYWWVTLELFFVYGEPRTPNSPWQMTKQHQTTLRSKTCLVGKLANVIWGENWDAKYFMDNSTKMSFGKVMHDMYKSNLKAWWIVQHVLQTLMGLQYN
jgi:hypothetical protein